MSDYGGDDDGPGGMDDYDGGFEEMEEPEPELDPEEAVEEAIGTEDPDARRPAGENNIVVGGDPTAAAVAEQKNAVQKLKEKRIANDKRMTTPYMTKYERARVLGTRALQIRFA